jgi:succinate-acetate transporter protein
MLVLSGVFNTRILIATNDANQDYMRVNYTLMLVYMLLVTGSQSKNVSCFCLDMTQYRSLIGQLLCTAIYWSNMGLVRIGGVFEMGILIRTYKRLLMESKLVDTTTGYYKKIMP